MTSISAAIARLDVGVHDLFGLAGYAAIVYGVSQWSEPAAWVTGGALLLAAAVTPTLVALRRKGHA